MKICWDNLENIYLTRNGNLKHINGNRYFIKYCKKCSEEFLGKYESIFCSKRCANLDSSRTEETKNKIRNSLTGRVQSKETIEKRRIKMLGELNPQYRKKSPFYKCGNLSWYDTYAHKISWIEEVRRAPDNENILEVRCKYCGKWFKPTKYQIQKRIESLNNNDGRYLYCSNECKSLCPIFKRPKFPKGFKSRKTLSVKIQSELRKLVFERDNYECQKCGYKSDTRKDKGLVCHHIEPIKLNPIESADMDNCITFCKKCHNEAHQIEGCKTGQIAYCKNKREK